MTLKEIAKDYEAAAVSLRKRLKELREALKVTDDPDEIWHLKRRIAELTPMLTECNALADICEHYYDPGYYRNDAYCFPKGCRRKPAGKSKNSDEDIHGYIESDESLQKIEEE